MMEVHLIDHMGDDLRVVNSARVSFAANKEDSFCTCTEILSEQDQKLIKYLADHNHWTPFSHVQITMREKVPIFVARQRFKHMVGFTYNEVSRRYVDDAPEFFTPDIWRKRSENKKQGSLDEGIETNKACRNEYTLFLNYAKQLYNDMLEYGVAPEQARMVLPQSMYTEYYTTGSLAAWARAYKLRSDPHAQREIQDLAKMWNDVISGIEGLEYSWEALVGQEK